MSSKTANAPLDLLDELQTTLAHGTVARRVETLRRVTDLFLNGAVDYSDEQIALFDDVFHCLDAAHRGVGPRRCSQPPCARRDPRRRSPSARWRSTISSRLAAPVLAQSESGSTTTR